MTFSICVGIPTYKRVDSLKRCLRALSEQTHAPERIIVTVAKDDPETLTFLQNLTAKNIIVIPLHEAHVFLSVNAILDAAKTDLIVFTDDDAEAPKNWLEGIAHRFEENKNLGALGGRDLIESETRQISSSKVGRVSWWGRRYGNHHLQSNGFFEVDYLKGVNMSFRAQAVKDVRVDLNVLSAQSMDAYEPHLCFKIKQKGWVVFYDASLVVKHWVEKRHGKFARDASERAYADFEHFYKTLLLYYPNFFKKVTFTLYALLIGEKRTPGLVFVFVRPIKTLGALSLKVRLLWNYLFLK